MALPDWSSNEETISALKRVSTATLTTQLFRRGFRTRFMQGVAPVKPGRRMVGSARTLRYIPMREDLDTLATLGSRSNAQRAVIEDIRRGEVLVIDGMRKAQAGSLGNILALRLQVRGAAGIVTDGAFRDTPSIRALDIPTYAAGQNANTNLTTYHPADYDLPIGCGGVLVEPGDAVVGDDEGVVIIPASLAEEVAHDALEQEIREHFIYQQVRGGESVFDVYPMNEQTARAYERWRQELTDEQLDLLD
ncbi:MAG: ribonuclease activity regulator RraA [Trueperaceae bacterium]|nr:MAG: ribonuclease activity regulator RraA [Trueperaceae bacterium]